MSTKTALARSNRALLDIDRVLAGEALLFPLDSPNTVISPCPPDACRGDHKPCTLTLLRGGTLWVGRCWADSTYPWGDICTWEADFDVCPLGLCAAHHATTCDPDRKDVG